MKQARLPMRTQVKRARLVKLRTKNPLEVYRKGNTFLLMMSSNINSIVSCLTTRSTSFLNLKDRSSWSERNSRAKSWWQLKSKSCSKFKRNKKRMAKSQILSLTRQSWKRRLLNSDKPEASISGKMTSLMNSSGKCQRANLKTKSIVELKNLFKITIVKCTKYLERGYPSWSSRLRKITQRICSFCHHMLVW